ncbi:hypothetical protein H4R19_003796 [Coemansia spiralis]|nr:hypothetical protein H4R19_003796 [Coemansia spiralis]
MDIPAGVVVVPSPDQLLEIAQAVVGQVPFIVTAEWSAAIQILAVLSLVASVMVGASVVWIGLRHRKYLGRLSLRISGFAALADTVNAAATIAMQQNAAMMAASQTGALRFVVWVYSFSALAAVFLTLSISVQLHLSTLTKVRVGAYMRLEQVYVPASFGLAAVLAAIQAAVMNDITWNPLLRAVSWHTDTWRLRLTLWMCNYMWLVATIVYCAGIALLVSLRILQMWRNSAKVATPEPAPRVPEKWDWSRLAASARSSSAESQATLEAGGPDNIDAGGPTRGGYMVTLTTTDDKTGLPVAVRTFVDRRRFLMSVQRLVCYPLVPVVTQLGVVAMNMAPRPVRGLWLYGTIAPAAVGLFNLVVFLLNPALPDILRDAVHRRA